ncbi:MAG: molybdopterin-dependent oxidoreductase [Deltaproteobacteria bacterium]|nr:molybdopterin-dependent oxidoreductase [Deltaproteobacteria bacterium]
MLDWLREALGLTGAKEGCDTGVCGACAVLIDGRSRRSCRLSLAEVAGAEVWTVEGLSPERGLSPLQRSLSAHGAVQCGYCTPGLVVGATALLERTPHPEVQAVRSALQPHLCRCTGYQQIVEAVVAVGRGEVGGPPIADGVGRSVERVDAADKLTGRARYTGDLPVPEGALHGALVRAWSAHALVRELDVGPALALPGVVRVLTAADVPGALTWGNAVQDQPLYASERIRFWGEPVALVLAESEGAARAGAAAVRVALDPLPPVRSPEEALSEGAPRLHPGGNTLTDLRLELGEGSAALDRAAVVVERTFRTGAQEHAALETEVALAIPEGGRITVYAPSQNVYFDRHHLCRLLALSSAQVRVIQPEVGAAFGSREDLYAQPHAALGALLTGRPVRVRFTRRESTVGTTKRHPAVMRYRLGADADGTLLGLEVDVLADTGAYASWGPNVAKKMLAHAAGPYRIPHLSARVRVVYTNRGISGAFRGYGAPQVTFAVEGILDALAEALGTDPVALRRRHLLRSGDRAATGHIVDQAGGLLRCLDRALEAAPPLSPPPAPWRVGRGVALGWYGIGYGHGIRDIGSAVAELTPRGFEIRCSAVDYGQGARTVFTQIAAEVLGVGRPRLVVFTGDSDTTPDSGSSVASRQTTVSGEAVRQAAERLHQGLVDHLRERYGVDEVRFEADGIALTGGPTLSWEALERGAREAGVRLRRQARVKSHSAALSPTGEGAPYATYAWGAHVAEVAVHPRTGQVRLLRLVAAHDVGRAIHPDAVRGQILGGAAQGVGMALLEDYPWDEAAVPVAQDLSRYRLPRLRDLPALVAVIVEEEDAVGPFGAKGVGEPPTVVAPAAIAAAVRDAVGAEVLSLPISRESLRERGSGSQRSE